MIANCGTLGLNWRDEDLSSYLEALEAHNDAHRASSGGLDSEQADKLRKFNAAHGGGKSDVSRPVTSAPNSGASSG